MCKQKHLLLILFFWIYTSSAVFSQINASPSFTGCAPYSVFLSGPPGASSEYWTLGTGMGTTTLSAPNPLYINPGTYNITYTAIVGGSPVSYNAQIVVKSAPSISYAVTLPSSHCAPMSVTLTGSGASPGSVYTWVYGDLSTIGSGATTTHTYMTGNSYVPILTAVDAASGCTLVANSGATVHVSNPANLLVNSSNGFSACQPPLITSIDANGSTSGSPLGQGLTYSWSFNNGSPSSATGASAGSVTFGAGQHTITISATDNNQCITTRTVPLAIVNPSVSAQFPPIVCLNGPVSATINTNQNTATVTEPSLSGPINIMLSPPQPYETDSITSFSTPGNHTITVTVQTPGCPMFTVSSVIFVEEVIASFTITPPAFVCSPSLIATYINLSTTNSGSSMTFTWQATDEPIDYNHGVPTQSVITGLGTPSFTFYQGSLNPYTVYRAFNPNITLTAQSNSSAKCKSSIRLYPHMIARPSALFFTDRKKGCAPLKVKFDNMSVTHPSMMVTSYTWCNGQSPPQFNIGTLSPPSNSIPQYSFNYTTPGEYHPYLIISTVGGCVDTSFIDTIIVVDPPLVTATYPATVCAGQPVTINMTGTASPGVPTASVIDHWHVITDKSYFSGCITNPNPTFPFTHLGVHNVVVTAYQADCATSVSLPQTILVKGPIGKFRYTTTCMGDKKAVTFTVHIQEGVSAVLNFGDSQTSAFTANPAGSTASVVTHTYSSHGDYTVTLSTSGSNGCPPYIFKQVIKIREPKAKITFRGAPLPNLPNALACVGDKYDFSGATSEDNYLSCGANYTWFYKTPTYDLPPISSMADFFKAGSFVIPGNPPGLIQADVDPIAENKFLSAGIYTLGLRVKDINGCTDSVTRLFRISDAKPVFTVPNPICLSNGTFQVNNTTQSQQVAPDAITKSTWDFGDQSPLVVSTDPNFIPVHSYTNVAPPSQTFVITAYALNSVGCSGIATKTVQVNNPRPNFSADQIFPCIRQGSYGLVNFSAAQGYATYSVNYGDAPSWNTSSSFNNVPHGYTVPGIYVATLTILDSQGCRATDSVRVYATGQPTASILLPNGSNGFCRPAQPVLGNSSQINVSPIQNYIWTIAGISSPPPGTPTLQTSFIDPVTTVSLTVSVGNLFLCPHTTTVEIRTYSPVATPVISPTVICQGGEVKAEIKIISEVAAWKWAFGDLVPQSLNYNTPFTPKTVSYNYTTYPITDAQGNATIALVYYGSNDLNNTCVKTELVPIRIVKVESDFKHQQDNYAHCLKIPDAFTITSTNYPDLTLNYDWDFGDKDTSHRFSPNHTYLQPGTYSVTLNIRDESYGCKASSVKQMTIFPLPTATLATDDIVCPNVPFAIKGSATPGISGIVTGTLNPDLGALTFDNNNTFIINGSLAQTSSLTLKVKDNNNCEGSSKAVIVNVQKPAPRVDWDTTVIIGQSIPINAFSGAGFTYTWSPLTTYLNCDTCFLHNPVSSSTMNITYTVMVEDPLKCSVVRNTYRINIDIKASLDVPSAFTPNGDQINDIIFAAGWGIKKLNYFRIFNRWGQLIFESNDLSIGWDGVFNGVPQNMETYVYQVSADTYASETPTISKTGTFKLIR